MKARPLHTIALLGLLLAAGCSKQEAFVPPSFIHMDGMALRVPDENPPADGAGFYTSDIAAAYVVAHFPGAGKVDTIGLFELPFTAPVLFSGETDYIEFYPAIEQSGSSKALPFYTFYHSRRHNNMVLHSGDTLDFGVDSTTYNLTAADVLRYDLFEPPVSGNMFDSVVERVTQAPGEACVGEGYGRVHVLAGESSKSFSIPHEFTVNDPTKLLYLELDTRSDMSFEVYMHSAYTTGGSVDKQPVMVVRGSETWQHLYINLGRTWSYFNHHPTFRLSFSALNVDGIEGYIRIDNARLLTTSVVL